MADPSSTRPKNCTPSAASSSCPRTSLSLIPFLLSPEQDLTGQKERESELYTTQVWSRTGEQEKELPCGASSPGASGWGRHFFLPRQPWGSCPPASPDTLPAFLIPLWDNPSRAPPGQQPSAAWGFQGVDKLGTKQEALCKLRRV